MQQSVHPSPEYAFLQVLSAPFSHQIHRRFRCRACHREKLRSVLRCHGKCGPAIGQLLRFHSVLCALLLPSLLSFSCIKYSATCIMSYSVTRPTNLLLYFTGRHFMSSFFINAMASSTVVSGPADTGFSGITSLTVSTLLLFG